MLKKIKLRRLAIAIFKLFKQAFQHWQQDNAAQIAAALAYYTVFSLTPLLVVAIAIAGSIFGAEAAKEEILSQIQYFVGNSGAEVIATILDNASQPEIKNLASLVSLAVLFIGASGVFVQLQEALNQIWNVSSKQKGGIKELIRKRILSFLMIFTIGFLLLLSLILSAAISALSNFGSNYFINESSILSLLNFLLSFALTTFLFAAIYKFLPDVVIAWQDVWLGAIFTSLLFSFGKYLLGLYLSKSSFSSAYGAAGSFVVLLAWVYYSAQIFLFGAELTQVYARQFGRKIISSRGNRRPEND